jgi:cupin 2 domain-containing protein
VRSALSELGVGGNLLSAPVGNFSEELVEQVAVGEGVAIERIVSAGQATPAGEWLEQERDEWVVLLEGEAELAYEDGSRLRLGSGDHVLIPAGERHRVEWTRTEPPCIWLAVHAQDLTNAGDAR